MEKTISCFILSVLICCQFALAQAALPGKPARRLEALKVAYVTRQLNLTSEEAEKFWPLYRNYIAELKQTRQERKADVDVLMQEESILNLRKKYRTEFKKVLATDARANQALTAERDFNTMIRKELQKRMEMKKEKS